MGLELVWGPWRSWSGAVFPEVQTGAVGGPSPHLQASPVPACWLWP